MALTGTYTYVGFGFGAIQSGLLALEAFRSGAYRRLVLAEVVPAAVDAMRRAHGNFAVNIAHADRIEQALVGPVEIGNPTVDADREILIDAIAEAEAIGTAVPSVKFYVSDGPGSIHRVIAEGLRRKAQRKGPRAVIYTAENHNEAAEILEEAVRKEIPAAELAAVMDRVRFLNTVVGKMSGVVADAASMKARGLLPVTPDSPRAFLVEAFNRILITKISFQGEPPYRRGIRVFEEKNDLLPFEEAKLYGHNATHALGGYLAWLRGLTHMHELANDPGMMAFLRAAFVEESGASLERKHRGLDPLFTAEGYAQYVDDLLERMMNPFLQDAVDRVGRDPARKLGWEDRLVGTMRLAMSQGIRPRRFAIGAAAAARILVPEVWETAAPLAETLLPLWSRPSADKKEQDTVLAQIEEGRAWLKRWKAAGFPAPESFR